MTRQTFVALVNNVPGVLARVDAVFRRQDVPLVSVRLEPYSKAPETRALVIVAEASPEKTALLAKLLARLVDVTAVLEPPLLHEAPAAENA